MSFVKEVFSKTQNIKQSEQAHKFHIFLCDYQFYDMSIAFWNTLSGYPIDSLVSAQPQYYIYINANRVNDYNCDKNSPKRFNKKN